MMKNISKFVTRQAALKRAIASAIPKYNYHSSATYNKKLSIGEASVVLQNKITNISQLVNNNKK
jgi:hypothetical protein